MKKGLKTYITLFLSTLQISAFTFGGGFVIIPMLKRKFVDKLQWIDNDEMLDLVAIAQSTPGAIAVNASVLIGYRVAGISGAVQVPTAGRDRAGLPLGRLPQGTSVSGPARTAGPGP